MLSKESMDIDITTLHPSFVGKVLNVNLNTVQLDSELAMSLRQALWKHKVLVFPDQSLNPEQFETVGKIFGTVGFKTKLTSGNYFKGLESVSSTSNVHIMSRTTPTYTEYPLLFGGDWHSDGSYDSYFSKNKMTYTMLYSKQVPEIGGDTEFMDLTKCIQFLPKTVHDTIKDWTIVHRGGGRFCLKEAIQSMGKKSFATYYFQPIVHTDQEIKELFKINRTFKILRYVEEGYIEQKHPIFLTHPRTNEKALFVSSGFSHRIEGLPKEESDKWIQLLLSYQDNPAFLYSLKWKPNMVVIWDNRVVNHRATPSEGDRTMYRMFVSDI